MMYVHLYVYCTLSTSRINRDRRIDIKNNVLKLYNTKQKLLSSNLLTLLLLIKKLWHKTFVKMGKICEGCGSLNSYICIIISSQRNYLQIHFNLPG